MDMFWTVYTSGYQHFEVTMGAERYVVDLNNRVCSFRGWKLTIIPYFHGVVAISSISHNVKDYVISCFTKDTLLASYHTSFTHYRKYYISTNNP